ncbi:MAG: ligand-binding sensor domain-containing protein [Planctomycetota bacterium]|jgi:ligand-binding sensor domain-containing protein
MHLHHSILTSSLIAALSACTLAQGSSSNGAPSAADSPPGQVVTEIDPRIWVIHQGQSGDYWFGSNGNGVYEYDGQQVTRYTKADGLSGHQVRDIEEDAAGNILISTTSGVSKFDGKKFTTLELVDASPSESGWKLDPHDVWIAFSPGNHGPCRYDGEKLYQLNLSKSPAEDAHRAKYPNTSYSPSGVYSIYKDRRGHLWFGTASVGLCRYDGQTLSWMYEERLTTTPNRGAFGIRSIYEDRAGKFWVTNTRQRFQISPEVTLQDGYSLIKYEKKEGLPDAQLDTDKNFTYYPSMTEDDTGALWMACGGDGVWKYDGEHVTRYSIGDGAYAISIHLDQEGKLWIGTTEHGIYTFEGSSFEPFSPSESGK